MTDTIKVYTTGNTLIATITGDTVTLSFNSAGYPYYNSTLVSEMVAELDSSEMKVVSSQSGLSVNNVRSTANRSGVSSLLRWGTNPSGAFELVYSTPSNSGDEMLWEIGAGVPVIRLTVKIVRR